MTRPPLLELLAQDGTSAGLSSTSGQLNYFINVATTPSGAALTLLGVVVVVAILASRHALSLFIFAAMFCLTMMLHEKSIAFNVLIGPLQSLRNVSRPLAFALLAAASVSALAIPAGTRVRPVGWVAACFLAFQIYYNLELTAFVDPLKGVLGIMSVTLMFWVCARALGVRMQSADDARSVVELYARAGVLYAIVNLLQLLLSPGASVAGGRLIGISGNAQQMGTLCGLFIMANAFVFQERALPKLARTISLATVGLLGLMLLWTGSRANILMTGIGLIMMYRLQFGRLLTFGVMVGVVLAILVATFAESTDPLSRFSEAGNTRTDVWNWAIGNFMDSPVFGAFAMGLDSAVESSYISAFANTGVIGGTLLLIPIAGLVGYCIAAIRLKATRPEYGGLCDYFVGTSAALIVVNAFEGFATGILTFPLMAMYSHFAIGSFIAETDLQGVGEAGADQLEPYEAGIA